jgi:chorismate lyase/3-hydroxybenzoate synthase
MSADRLPAQAARAQTVEAVYVTSAELQTLLHEGRSLLGEIRFGTVPRDPASPHPQAQVGMAQLNNPPLIEAWLSCQPVSYHQVGRIQFARSDEALFGCIALAEIEPADFEGVVRGCYAEILPFLDTQAYPQLLRMWNYFPAINAALGDLDRYQCFCRGRFEALQKYYAGQFDQCLPAASAVGSHDGDLVIYFLAAKTPGKHCENPRQMSAYHYPPQYGPRSPSFARATLKRWPENRSCVSGTSAILGGRPKNSSCVSGTSAIPGGRPKNSSCVSGTSAIPGGRDEAAYLYISGTASIVGHESLHLGDPRAQLEETLENIRALIERVEHDGVAFRGLDSLTHLKVYVRHPEHLHLIQPRLDALFGSQVAKLYLTADICRAELLMEIEAIARAP